MDIFGMELEENALPATIILYAAVIAGLWLDIMGTGQLMALPLRIGLSVIMLPLTYFIVNAMANK
jgi:hypothetical protein